MTELREYKKASYQVTVVRIPAGICVYNVLDNSYCTTDEERCFVITGLKGEQWPVKGKDITKKYLNLDGTPIDITTWTLGERKTVQTNTSGPHILVYFADQEESFPAPASWGMTEPLVAKPGDAIAFTMLDDGTPDESDKYVIDRKVFDSTYTEA